MTRLRAILLALLVSLAAPLAAKAAAIAKVDAGWLSGATRGGSEVFLGVPYAAPPVGALRWAAPAPAPEWSNLRPATASAAACSAPANGDGPRSVNEDCLYLDIYRPAGAKPGDRLPVMVFVHGGADLGGSPGVYDGARMAEVGQAIVVIPAYRLGVFGALAAPEAGKAGGGYSLQDLTSALSWVKRNAGALGGDAADITLLGQSSGASNVCALLASPGIRGLFNKAILQSGACARPTLDEAQARARAFAQAVGCPAADLACLRGKDAGVLLDAWMGLGTASGASPAGTDVLPEDPAVALAAGRVHQMPLLIGVTRGDDRATTCPTLALADKAAAHMPVSLYEFADPQASELRLLLGYKAAAQPLDAAQTARGDEMIRRWTAFGRIEGWPGVTDVVQRFDQRGAGMLTRAAVEAGYRCGSGR